MNMAAVLAGVDTSDPNMMELLFEMIGSDNHTVLITAVVVVSAFVVVSVVVVIWKRVFRAKQKKKLLVVKQTEAKHKQHSYMITVVTGSRRAAGTKGFIQMTLTGKQRRSLSFNLNPFLHDPKRDLYRRGGQDKCILLTKEDLGDLFLAEVELQASDHSKWFLSYIVVQDMDSLRQWYFPYHDWIWSLQDCAARVALVPGVTSRLRLVGDNFLRGLRKHHIWRKLLVHLKNSSHFNAILSLSYCNCLSLCFIFANTMVYSSLAYEGDLSPSYTKSFLLSVLSNAIVTVITSFLEVGVVSVEHRNRFEYIDDLGSLMEETVLKAATKLEKLDDSLWKPDMEGGYKGFEYPGEDELEDDVFEAKVKDDRQTYGIYTSTPLKSYSRSPVMSPSVPLRSAMRSPLASGLARDIARAADSTYKIMENERNATKNISWNDAAEMYLFSEKSPVRSVTARQTLEGEGNRPRMSSESSAFTGSPAVMRPRQNRFSESDSSHFAWQKNQGSLFRPVLNYNNVGTLPQSQEKKQLLDGYDKEDDEESFETMHGNIREQLDRCKTERDEEPEGSDCKGKHTVEGVKQVTFEGDREAGIEENQIKKKLKFEDGFNSESGSDFSIDLELKESESDTHENQPQVLKETSNLQVEQSTSEEEPARLAVERKDLKKEHALRVEKLNDIITDRMEEFLSTKLQMKELDKVEVRRIVRTETNTPPHATPSNNEEGSESGSSDGMRSPVLETEGNSLDAASDKTKRVSEMVHLMLGGFIKSVQRSLILGKDIQEETLANMENELVNVVENAKLSVMLAERRKCQEKVLEGVSKMKRSIDKIHDLGQSQQITLERRISKEVGSDNVENNKEWETQDKTHSLKEEDAEIKQLAGCVGENSSHGFELNMDQTTETVVIIDSEEIMNASDGRRSNQPCLKPGSISEEMSQLSEGHQVKERTSMNDIQEILDLGPVSKKLSDVMVGQVYANNVERVEKRADDILITSQASRENVFAVLSNALNIDVIPAKQITDETKAKRLQQIQLMTAQGNKMDIDVPIIVEDAVNKLPLEMISKVKDDHVLKVADATLQSVLSEDISSRFQEILSEYGRTEMQHFASDVVGRLYGVVRQKLKSLLRLELQIDQLNSDGIPVERPQSPESGERQCQYESMLAAADIEVQTEVLPVITDHLVSLILEEAHTLETIDVDLMMMAFGGQFVETVVTNAVLQTRVGLVKGAQILLANEKIGDNKWRASSRPANVPRIGNFQYTETNELVTQEELGTLNIKQVLVKVVESLQEKLTHKSKKDLEELMGDEKIHCGLCKPKVVRDISERLVHMTAAKFITKEVFSKALAELKSIQEGCHLINTFGNDQRSVLMQRVGDALKGCQGITEVSSGSQEQQDVVGSVVSDLTEYIIESSCSAVAEQLILLMDLEYSGDSEEAADREAVIHNPGEISEVIEQKVRAMLKCTGEADRLLTEEDSVCPSNSNCNAGSDPLEKFSAPGLSSELEEIRGMITKEKKASFDAGAHLSSNEMESDDGCLYHMYYYDDHKTYHSAMSRSWVFYLVLGAIIILSLACFIGAILFGLKFGDTMARQWLTSFSLAMFQHVFLLETVKVFFLAIFASVCGHRLL